MAGARIFRSMFIAIYCLVVVYSNRAYADFLYSDFSNLDGLSINGDASQSGSALRVSATPENSTGSVWHSARQTVSGGFQSEFQFQITEQRQWNTGELGGDGFAFVIQNDSVNAIGNSGFYMGYEIGNSLAIEFDTFYNHWWPTANTVEPNNNHVGVQSRGTAVNTASYENSRLDAFYGVATLSQNISDGSIHTARIIYKTGSLQIFVDDFVNPYLDVTVDLENLLDLENGAAFVGFTAGGDTATENHDILNWSFSSIPEPSSCLFSFCTILIAVFRQRTRTL